MLTDSLLNFQPYGAPLSCVGAAGTLFPCSNPLDLLGVGIGLAPPNIIGVQSALFGSDTGEGSNRPLIQAVVGTAFVTANGATLTMLIQGAPDLGSTGGYQPGTWQTFAASAALTAAQLTAGQEIRMDWPSAFPDNANPRFLRAAFQTPSGQFFTAGTIAFVITTMARDDVANKYAQRNYSV
jgi:hypothetical protein